ncbi:ATP-binding protein [Brevibacillus massiliensis]|uniref:ATP-binding protein n=1 Tax=Brevibacillus massiliensis TaxID=1118054 RepID=UPI0003183E7B|nr:ATP-binding protein [Brevibacillus massiliensis]
MAYKVLPPRPVSLLRLSTGERVSGELRAVSRLAIGIASKEPLVSDRYEVDLATDFRIIGSTVSAPRDSRYMVLDIEKVLRKEEVLERLLLEEFQHWHLTHELEPAAILERASGLNKKQLEAVKRELDKLSILRQIHDIYMFVWDKGQFRSLGDIPLGGANWDQLKRLCKDSVASGNPIREQLFSEQLNKVFDTHIVPMSDRSCGIAIIDVTEAILAERIRKQQEWQLYKDILSVVTGEKLMLLQDEQLYELIRSSKKYGTVHMQHPADLAHLRKVLRELLGPFGLPSKRLLHYVVAVNEAATNTLTHGQSGSVEIYVNEVEQVCRVVVFDKGQGISLADLPKAALVHGFSTRASLGAGFHVMLQYADKLMINSTPQGTKLVLELHLA